MKTLLFLSVIFISFVNKPNQYYTDFEKGYEYGYCEGWKDYKGQLSICPITPIAPLPKLNRDRYVDGYNLGFKQGRYDAYQSENR